MPWANTAWWSMLLKPFPNETLHGRLCRSLSVSGYSVQKFTRSLGLESRSSFHPFLTQHLTDIADVNHENPRLLWLEQTLFPLWVWAMPRYAKELRQLNGPPARLQWFYQLTGNHSSQRMQLHFCPACAREDAMHYGVPYWHCEHQIPGVSVCYRHRCQLLSRPVPSSPHIAVEYYPDQFYESEQCDNIDVDFARYACVLFSNLVHQIENPIIDADIHLPKRIQLSKAENSRRIKLDTALNNLVKCILDSDTEPAVVEKLRLLHYIYDRSDNIPPSRKLFLKFCLQRYFAISDKVNLAIKDESQYYEERHLYDNRISTAEIKSLMQKTWLHSSLDQNKPKRKPSTGE